MFENATQSDVIISVNDTYSVKGFGPVVCVNLEDFSVGEEVPLEIHGINRCGEKSQNSSRTSVKIPAHITENCSACGRSYNYIYYPISAFNL